MQVRISSARLAVLAWLQSSTSQTIRDDFLPQQTVAKSPLLLQPGRWPPCLRHSPISTCNLKSFAPEPAHVQYSMIQYFNHVSLWHVFSCPHEAWVNCNELWLELSESSLPTSASWSKIRGQTTKFIPLPTIINQSTLQKTWSAITKKLQKSSLTPPFFPSGNSTEHNELMFIGSIKFQGANPPLSIPEYFRAGLLFLCSVLSALRFKDKIPPHPLGQHIEIWCHSLIFAMFWKKNRIHLIHILIEPVLIIKMILTAES